MNVIIEERNAGFPDTGRYVPGDDGNLYEVVCITSRIMTHDPLSGRPNYVKAQVNLADWDDCPEGEEFPGMVVI